MLLVGVVQASSLSVSACIQQEEPYMKPGLAQMKNAVVVPHIASASKWTREGMATLAALNIIVSRFQKEKKKHVLVSL
jgi:lactate dehydrogenase-like 2-hydroxyacid dehydrogenase